MLHQRWLIAITLSFLPGAAIGRFVIPQFIHTRQSTTAATSQAHGNESSANALTATGAHDPRSRAIDVLDVGDESKPIPPLSEILRGTSYLKLDGDASRFADSLDEAGVLAALDQVETATEGNAKNTLAYNLIRRLAELNPKAALARVEKFPNREMRNGYYTTLAYSWGGKDFPAAKAWAMSLKNPALRTAAMQGLITTLAETDPDQAIQLALSVPGNSNQFFTYNIFSNLTSANPALAAQKAIALPLGQFRQQAISIVAGQWASIDPVAARRWVESLPPGQQQQSALNNVISQWSSRDPEAAAAYAEKMPPGSSRKQLISSLAGNWAQQDSAAAVAWVQSLPKDQTSDYAMRNVLSRWASDDPQAAAEFASKLPDSPSKRNYLQSISSQWASNDPDGAMQWAEKHPEAGSEIIASIIGQMAGNDPAAAAAKVATITSPEARDNAMQQVANQWSDSDPKKAIGWLTTMPAGDKRDDSMKNAVANWTRSSPDEVTQWLTKLPASDTRDKMVGTFAGNIVHTDPGASVAWANAIDNQTDRMSGVQWALKAWVKNDRGAATNWVNQQTLTPADRTAFLGTINNAK